MKLSENAVKSIVGQVTIAVIDQLAKEETRLDQSVISGIISQVKAEITTEDEKRIDFYQQEIFSPEVKESLKKSVLDQIPIPEDGKPGEKGEEGEPGKDAQPIPLTEKDKKEIANFVDVTKLVKDRKQDLITLVEQLKSGKIKLPSHAGIDVKEIIAEINKILGTDDWQYGKFFNGAIFEDHKINASSNGTVATLTLEQNGGGDLSLFFDGRFYLFDSTPAASVTLTPGSDLAPTLNFVYIPNSTKVLTVNTTGFPIDEQFVPVAEILVQSVAGIQTDGAYKVHAWTDHLSDLIGQGHLSHILNWIRRQPATWFSGVAPATAITTNGGAIDNVYYSNNSGNILQLHEHTFPARDMETGDPIFILNDPNTAYRRTTDLSTADETSLGETLRSNNTYYSIVVWGVISEDQADSKIYANLPSGSYAGSVDAITDPLGFTDTTIPSEFTGTGFLIARVILKYRTFASGTITEILTEDLRRSTGAGGGVAGGTEFSDNLFRILNVFDSTKEIDFDASGITTGNTRTITMPDRDVDLGNPVFDTSEVDSTGAFYLGDKSADGSWRIIRSGTNLNFERRESNVWIPKGGVTA